MKIPMFLRREKWVIVRTMTGTGITFAAGQPHEKKDGKIYVHLYESNKGRRKIESVYSFSGVPQHKIDEYVKGTETYNKQLLRWLSGRYDPEIPRYSDIGEEDTANALRGKIE
jgi:hypothetical protein